MRVALCASLEAVRVSWKNHIKQTDYKAKIINNTDELMDFLLKHKKAVICLEDKWTPTSLKEVIISIQEWYPKARIFALSQAPNFEEGMELLNIGVKGYGNAHMQHIHFIDALKSIKKDNLWLYPEFVQMMIKNINNSQVQQIPLDIKLSELSKREKEVAKLIHEGYTNQEIADITNITLRTVKAHTSSIYEKLNVKDRVGLVLHLNQTV